MSIYDYRIQKADGTEISMEEYRGKVLLIVNTATVYAPVQCLAGALYRSKGQGL